MGTSTTDHIVILDQLGIGYAKGRELLNKIDLRVGRGEMVALIGRNGTGKSTLLKSMIGLIPLLKGNCYLDGVSLNHYTIQQRAKVISYVSSQVSQLPSLSVRELVSLGRMPHTGWMGRFSGEDNKLVKKALTEVNMQHLIDRRLDQLSDGERQSALIARAFVQDTPLMVLDEPTAFLDIPNKYELIRLLSQFRNQGKSIVYSTHDLETALMCADKLWVIHQEVVREGAPEDLGVSGLFDALFDAAGIAFDREARKFKYKSDPKGTVRLRGGPEIALIWTRNAIERVGFEVNGDGNMDVEVAPSETGFRWILTRNGLKEEFHTLYSLARFLNRDE